MILTCRRPPPVLLDNRLAIRQRRQFLMFPEVALRITSPHERHSPMPTITQTLLILVLEHAAGVDRIVEIIELLIDSLERLLVEHRG